VVVKVINPDIEQQLEPLRSAIVFQIEQNTLKRDLSVQAIADELSSLKVQIVAARDNENVRLLSELELKKAELEEELRMTDADFEGIRTALSERLVGLEELSQVGMYSYTTREGCLVSYRLDGYEYFLSPSNLGLINVEDLQSIADRVFTVDDGMDVAIGQPVVRIVNRFRMCIGFVVSGETLSLFDDVTTISLRFGKHSRETHNATVMKVLTSIQKDAAMIVCELASYVDELTDDRIIPAEIIFQGHSGIILPEKAVIQVRGKEHVYVVSDGAHVAVPVKVKGRIDGRVAVEGVMEGARVIVNP
jgi:putative membrane fusion protein